MKLNHRPFSRYVSCDVIDFALQRREVRDGDIFVFLYGNRASAEQAKVFAKRDVHIQRKWSGQFFRARIIFLEIVWSEVIFPYRRGWVTRIARAGAVIFFENRVGDLLDLAGV